MMGWDDQTRGLCSNNNFTYVLVIGEDDGSGGSDKKFMLRRQVYVLPGGGQR
jgi:hypothetical protein